MSRDFLQSLELDESFYSAGNLIVVHENGRVDGGFIGHFIVADFIRRYSTNARVILVLNVHSQLHWAAIAGRIGWNFNTSIEKGQLVVMDLMKEAYISLTKCSQEESGESADHPGESCIINPAVAVPAKRHLIDLDELLEKISHFSLSRKPFENATTGEKVEQLIVIEDLSSLLYQEKEDTLAEKNSTEFLCKLKTIAKSDQSVLLTLVSSASEDSVDFSGNRFAKLVAQVMSEVCIQVSPLSTGFSPQISGYLTICNKINRKNKWIKSNHYKLDDRNIRITPL